MIREEEDTQLKKNTVFRRNKKCISQENNNNHQHNDNSPVPRKMLKMEFTLTTESESENLNNNIYTLPVSNQFSLSYCYRKYIMVIVKY